MKGHALTVMYWMPTVVLAKYSEVANHGTPVEDSTTTYTWPATKLLSVDGSVGRLVCCFEGTEGGERGGEGGTGERGK